MDHYIIRLHRESVQSPGPTPTTGLTTMESASPIKADHTTFLQSGSWVYPLEKEVPRMTNFVVVKRCLLPEYTLFLHRAIYTKKEILETIILCIVGSV